MQERLEIRPQRRRKAAKMQRKEEKEREKKRRRRRRLKMKSVRLCVESASTCFVGVFSSYTLCSKGGAGSVDLNLSGNDISIIGVVVV